MLVFLDFEASSLSKHSYPIEIAWVFENGSSRSILIRPEPGWTDWSEDAQEIHGISKELLQSDGIPASQVVEEMMATLKGHELLASSPSWDGKWLSVLLRAGGERRHALRVTKSDDAFAEAAAAILRNSAGDFDVARLVAEVISASDPVHPPHRALPDARLELERLHLVRRAALAMISSRSR